jgi:hypothetical protein
MSYTIGIDFGGVLSKHDSHRAEHRNTSIDMPGALVAIENLKKDGHVLHLVSYCGKTRAIETIQSIKKSPVASSFEKLFFVTDREYKQYVCNFLGCDFMIDDNSEILDCVAEHNPKIVTIEFDFQDSTTHNAKPKKTSSRSRFSWLSWLSPRSYFSCCKRHSSPKRAHQVAHSWQDVEDIIKRHTNAKVVPNPKLKVSNYCHHV